MRLTAWPVSFNSRGYLTQAALLTERNTMPIEVVLTQTILAATASFLELTWTLPNLAGCSS